jgi:hypothetical protein
VLRQRDPRVAADNLDQKSARRSIRDYLNLFRTRSYLINCVAQTLMTFVQAGWGFGRPICVITINLPILA